MKTLQEIKDTYAQEQGYEDWVELVIINELNSDRLDKHWTEICIRAQKEALEKAAENVDYEDTFAYSSERNRYDDVVNSITTPENLIR